MTNTPNGLPYPTGTDAADVPFWNQQLAEWLDPKFDDTGIVNTGFVAQPGWTLNTTQARARGGIVMCYLNFTRSGANITSNTNGNITNFDICQIPPSIPNPQMASVASVNASGYPIGIFCWTNGMIGCGAILPGISLITGDQFSASFIWLASGW